MLAEEFHVRIEMKQIGARQEAGRIGGIGPCGRELCCATFVKNFNSVSTAAARFQDISPNPQKLAGQCAKLKCCLNYEVDTYVESFRKLPSRDIQLETADATYYYFKADILSEMITYSTDKRMAVNLETISASRAQQVIEMNKRGEKPLDLNDETVQEPEKPIDLVEQEDLTRFDKQKKKKKNNRNKGNRNENHQQREEEGVPVNAEKTTAQQGGERNNHGRRDNNRRRGDRRNNGRRHEGGAGNSQQKQGE